MSALGKGPSCIVICIHHDILFVTESACYQLHAVSCKLSIATVITTFQSLAQLLVAMPSTAPDDSKLLRMQSSRADAENEKNM